MTLQTDVAIGNWAFCGEGPSPERVGIVIDGVLYQVIAGIPVIVALQELGFWHLRNSPKDRRPRGAFCLMGACQECVVRIDGITRPACMTRVTNDMIVVTSGKSQEET